MSESNPSKYLGNELTYLERVLNSESWTSTGGSWVNNLEAQFAMRVGSRFAVAMNSGTSTLHAALVAVGARPGDEVISPALTVIMDTTATIHAGCVPVYADVRADTFNVDPECVRSLITDRTRAVIAVSLYGLPAELRELRAICDERGVALIEDNAQCFSSSIFGSPIGTFGDVASWSFENTKHLSAGEGGMVTTSSESLATAMRKFGGHGFKNLTAEEGRVRLREDVFQAPDYLRHDELGWNYRMPEFVAAVALAQLERAEELVRLRRLAASELILAMEGVEFLTPQLTPVGYDNSYYTLAVKFDERKAGVSWKEFRLELLSQGGDGFYGAWAVPYLEPVIRSGRYLDYLPDNFPARPYEAGLCPVAERVQPTIMQFKTNYRSEALVERQSDALRRTIRKTQEVRSRV